MLDFSETKRLLEKYKIPLGKSKIVASQKEALIFAQKYNFPVVLKIFSPKILHKTDIGGVILNINNQNSLTESWEKISKLAKKQKAKILIQKQLEGQQLIIGAKYDQVFGPVIMFGLGGIFVEILKDVSFRLAPITKKEAKEMIKEIKSYRILAGARKQKKVNLEKLSEVLVNCSRLISEETNIKEVDLNPVIANQRGVFVVDAKIIKNSKEKSSISCLSGGQKGKQKTKVQVKAQKIFNPKSVAVIGATDRPGSVGRGLCQNLLEGKNKRKIYFVNPFKKEVFGYKTYPKITDIKEKIDLAIIAVPSKIVPQVTKDCVKKQVGGVIIISAGFAEIGKKGEQLQKKITEILKTNDIPLIGPNCLGIIIPSIKLNASFAPTTPKPGNIAFISQSGALIDSVIDRSLIENYGFSFIVSYGNEADLTLADFLKLAQKDKQTKVITLYIEGLKNGCSFFETSREITQTKPIIILKGGKSKQAKKAVSSHTGSLAGEKEIYSAAFKQAGIIEVQSIEEMFDVAKSLSWQPRCKNNIGIVTNGGGAGVITTDYCEQLYINLAKLKKETIKKINRSPVMPPHWSKRNPVDIVGDALPERYKVAIEALLQQQDICGLIVIQTLQIMTNSLENAKIIIGAKKKWPKKPIITVFMGGKSVEKAVKLLEKNKIPNYPDPLRAVKAMKALINE